MPDFDATAEKLRLGARVIRLVAADGIGARGIAQSGCDSGESHCPPEWCTDDVGSLVVHVRQIGAGE